MKSLLEKSCSHSNPKLKKDEIDTLYNQISKEWEITDNNILKRTILFDKYEQNIDFANKVAKLAIAENHHPDMYVAFKYLTVYLTTHYAQGLTENDFIVAAKIDKL